MFQLTILLTSGVTSSTAVNADFIAKLLTSGILFFNSVSFVLLTKSVTSVIFFLILRGVFDIRFSKQMH